MLSSILLILALGCSSNAIHIGGEVSRVTITEYESNEPLVEITEKSKIDDITRSLEKAKTVTTSAMDIALPDYKLSFRSERNEVILELGYYIQPLKLDGISGHYWSSEKDLFIGSRIAIEVPQ